MCDTCSKDIENVEGENIDLSGLLDNTSSEVTYVDPVILNTDNLGEDIEFDKAKFNEGLRDGSYLAGFYTALINCGMSNVDAINTLQLKMTSDMNIILTDKTNIANIEISKNQTMILEKQQM